MILYTYIIIKSPTRVILFISFYFIILFYFISFHYSSIFLLQFLFSLLISSIYLFFQKNDSRLSWFSSSFILIWYYLLTDSLTYLLILIVYSSICLCIFQLKIPFTVLLSYLKLDSFIHSCWFTNILINSLLLSPQTNYTFIRFSMINMFIKSLSYLILYYFLSFPFSFIFHSFEIEIFLICSFGFFIYDWFLIGSFVFQIRFNLINSLLFLT